MKRHIFPTLVLTLAASVGGHALAEPRLLTIDDIAEIRYVSGPSFSPDGRQVAYTLDGRIHVAPVKPGDSRALTTAVSQAWSPHWSADGKALYFLSDRTESSQLWKLPLDQPGEAEQITDLDFSIDDLRFSPDESRLLLGKSAKRENEEEEGTTAPWVIDRLQFKEDSGDGYITNDTPNHFHAYDLNEKKLEAITEGQYTNWDAAWSPDGQSIVFVSNREAEPDASYRSDLWVAGIDDIENGKAPLQLTDNEETKHSPAWSPDGKSIAYISAVDGVYGVQRVTLIPASGGMPRILTEALDRWVNGFRFSPNGRWIYFNYENHGGVHLARVNVASGKIEQILQEDNMVSAFDIHSSGRLAARVSTTNGTADLFIVDGSKKQRLTDANGEYFSELKLGSREKVTFESPDGTVVEAFVTRPPDFDPDNKYPAVLHIHGGPLGQFTYGYNFTAQFMAAKGYVVIQPNPRGSTGRGQDFIRAIYKTWGITDYPDLIAAVDHVIELGYVDPDRLSVTGYSYGGYMTNVVITRSDRFKAAASGAGHSLIIANYGHDIYQQWYNWELGPPWTNREGYDLLSPLLGAGNVVTPTLFYGGREDWNVPVLNAELFYQSLRTQGVPTQLVVYPDSHHGGWSEDFEKDAMLRVERWFAEHGAGPETAEPD